MGARAEIESVIYEQWVDMRVAAWVVENFPLLKYENLHTKCPVFKLDLETGLTDVVDRGDSYLVTNLCRLDKIVMSGGFEGTRAHLRVVDEMHEVRALTTPDVTKFRPIGILLEPDGYILRKKGREPLINIERRIQLWSTSGLVDFIIVLPDKPETVSSEHFYEKVHSIISPALWCANMENKFHMEIVSRGMVDPALELIRLFIHKLLPHTSFILATRDLKADELLSALEKYSWEMTEIDQPYQMERKFASHEFRAQTVFEDIVNGLEI